MGIAWEEVVVIQQQQNEDEASMVTISCPDQAGLGCDLCRIILEFGLRISRAGISLFPSPSPSPSNLLLLFSQIFPPMEDGATSCFGFFLIHLRSNLIGTLSRLVSFLLPLPPLSFPSISITPPLLLSFTFSTSGVLIKKDCYTLIIQRLKAMPTPDGRVLNMFFITDAMELLHTKKRQDCVCEYLMDALGEKCISSELQLAGPEHMQGFSSLPPAFVEELFSSELLDKVSLHPLSQDMTTLKTPTVIVDNSLSPAHTLLQIQCVDQKGLCYDIMRISKDSDIKVTFGRFSSSVKGFRNIDLFVQQNDGKKIIDPESQKTLCSCLKEEMHHPLRVIIVNRGPDTELLVANPVELSGKGRPRVFYDVTLALKALGVCIFAAEVVRHSTQERQWEVYRFLLEENRDFPLTRSEARSKIVDKVRRTLMGW